MKYIAACFLYVAGLLEFVVRIVVLLLVALTILPMLCLLEWEINPLLILDVRAWDLADRLIQ